MEQIEEQINEQTEEEFLCFRIGRMSFILPIFEIVRILSYKEGDDAYSEFHAGAFGELPILDFCRSQEEGKDFESVIVLKEEETYFGIAASKIEGLIQIRPEYQYDIPEMLVDEQNAYLTGISYWPEQKKLLFLLETCQLLQYMQKEE